ncbi:histidine kinase dimerization/phosphoacceptor domain-containing protein [Nocardioides sp. TF02-7]|uniref:sensor histidine kinase n=1 Tax=Nocardioides sp. TF02-7 TaxID=2917724 RepID=UPI001F05FA39|nr:histidine kinase dimerization/phosphoacceptor domain-containing protein [Nocardioides sp. TF02-7]UMG91993.1 histidine kinase dimerization/phosphoacceptor domain-containing protein [Nocardioides sp. TF02-7]
MAFVALGLVTDPLVGDAAVATPYLTILFLLGSLGWYAGPRTGLVGVAAVLGCGLAPDLLTGTAQPADVVVNAVLIVLPWVLLRGLRIATDRRVLAEVAADRTAREAVEAERRRIAQDLHDSMAHALTLITLHAGSARERTTDTGSADALAAIERSGREALADMHRYLGLLGPRDGEAPGLADIDDLVEGVRRGGARRRPRRRHRDG